MSKITLKEEPNQVYFKTTTQYQLDVDGKELLINIEEDSNEGQIHYHYDGNWSIDPPDFIMEIGENEWGGLRFEEFIWENVSGWKDGETLDTEEE